MMASTCSYAARPFVTDDARLTNAESCQLESWSRSYKTSHEFWVLPACNVAGNFEVTAGTGTATSPGQSSTNDSILQGKTLFRELSTNGWGWGLAFGRVNHRARYAIVPNLFQIDTTIGRQFNGSMETRWISFGLRITPDKMF